MSHGKKADRPLFSSNVVRLTIREWVWLLVIMTGLAYIAGPVWKRLEPFEPSANYRIPFDSSENYWLFERYCGAVGQTDKTLLIGDSFIWGHFVTRHNTLASFLNSEAGSARFANIGLDGTHPLALEGLMRHHCGGLEEQNLVLHLNLLWMSSPEADLNLERVARLNHPRLLPQFSPSIPALQADVSERIGTVVGRYFPSFGWARHLRSEYFRNMDFPNWTLEHPYRNPLSAFGLSRSADEDPLPPNAQPWFSDGSRPQNPPWVELETSRQWRAFKRLVSALNARANSLFVLVGPLNEHMLEAPARDRYRHMVSEVELWLQGEGVPYHIPPVLPSEFYADLSHPLAAGYAILAGELFRDLSRDRP